MSEPRQAPDPQLHRFSAHGRDYCWSVLAVLFVVHLFSAMDRTVIQILGQAIKVELRLADWQLGLLGGLAFSLLYVGLGFPLARLADSGPRVRIITVCMLLWSAMTALCGIASSFAQLILFRMGVGVGEAGCLPTSHSLIGDYFPPAIRATALSLFGIGLPLGALLGTMLGGLVMDAWGWRTAFLIVGIPGVAVALLAWLVVREPPRGRFDAPRADDTNEALSFIACVQLLVRSPVARNVLLAVTLSGVFTSPTSVFLAPYIIRRFGLGYGKLGLVIAGTFMLGAVISTLASGMLVDWAGKRDVRWYMGVPAIGCFVCVPLYVLAYSQSNWVSLVILLGLGSVAGSAYLAPSFAVLHNLVPSTARAKTTAILQLLLNLIGLGLGPLLCGIAIDVVAATLFSAPGGSGFSALCPGGQALDGAPQALQAGCRNAVVSATQYVLIAFSLFALWPAMHFFLAAIELGKSRANSSRDHRAPSSL